jgi:hypothetical protein
LAEFIDGWCIDRGSQLCFYDSRFYFLKFTKPGDGGIKMRWNLPVTMTARLEELKVMAQDPAEHAGESMARTIESGFEQRHSAGAGGRGVACCCAEKDGAWRHSIYASKS